MLKFCERPWSWLRVENQVLDDKQTIEICSLLIPGIYPCLFIHLVFKREFSYYLIQIYIPCCMLVIVSWVSFWLDQNAIPARVSLGVTTLLTMATQTSSINSSLPPVSYTKAIDVWTGVCLTFVFGALLEFALVNYASRSAVHKQNNRNQGNWDIEGTNIDVSDHMEDGPTTFAMVIFYPHLHIVIVLEHILLTDRSVCGESGDQRLGKNGAIIVCYWHNVCI